MLWVAVPLAFGIALSEFFSVVDFSARVCLAIAFLLLALCGNFLLFEKFLHTKIAFAFAVFFGAIFYYSAATPANPYPNWNTRETRLSLTVERASANAKGASYGFARVTDSADYFSAARNMRIWFYVSDNSTISRGDKIEGNFTARLVEGDEGFDAYLKSQRVHFNAANSEPPNVVAGGFPFNFYNSTHDFILRQMARFPNEEILQSQGARAYMAMILGDKTLLDEDAKNSFLATGTMHIFAISGMHVALVASVIYWLMNLLRLPRKMRPFICLPILFLYVQACGAPPSAMRAFLMIALIWASVIAFRKPKPFAGFAAAFTLAIIVRPSDLFDAGFALSYAVVAAILLYAVPMITAIKERLYPPFYVETRMSKIKNTIVDYLVAAFAISFAAIFASAPLSAAFFGYVAPLSLPFSILYAGLSGIVIALGFFAMFLPAFIAIYTNWAAALITGAMIEGAHWGAAAGWIINVKISGAAAFLIESALVCVLLLRHKIPNFGKWILFPALCVAAMVTAGFFNL